MYNCTYFVSFALTTFKINRFTSIKKSAFGLLQFLQSGQKSKLELNLTILNSHKILEVGLSEYFLMILLHFVIEHLLVYYLNQF